MTASASSPVGSASFKSVAAAHRNRRPAARGHYRHELEKMVRAGATWQGGNPRQKQGYVWTTEIGTPLSASNFVRRHVHPLCQRAGHPRRPAPRWPAGLPLPRHAPLDRVDHGRAGRAARGRPARHAPRQGQLHHRPLREGLPGRRPGRGAAQRRASSDAVVDRRARQPPRHRLSSRCPCKRSAIASPTGTSRCSMY